MNQQPFRLGTGGDWGFRGGDRAQGSRGTSEPNLGAQATP